MVVSIEGLIRPYEGVCDTPLHMFDEFRGLIGLRVGSVFAHVRAYAIRPYSFWLIAWGGWCGWFAWFAHVEGVCDTPLHLFD